MAVMKQLDYQLRVKPALIVVAVGLILWFIPCPEGVDPKGWKVLAIFLATILGLLTKPIAMGGVVFFALTMLALTKTLPLGEVLTAFANANVWLIVTAFFISRGFAKTGLGNRIGYNFIKKLGHTTLGLAYATCFTQYTMGPATPSSTARSGGTIAPLVLSLARVYGSDPEHGTQRKIGSYLMFTAFAANFPVSSAFLTAMAGNPLGVSLAAEYGIEITWVSWAWGALVPALCAMCVIPIFIYWIYPPEIKHSPEARDMAEQKLKEMGPMTKPEKFMAGTFVGLLVLWIAGTFIGLHATIAAFIGLMFMVYSGVLTWDDVLSEKGAYDCLIWFSGMIMMASCLNKYGVIKWASAGIASFATGFSWPVALFITILFSVYCGYGVASTTAFIGATYSAFLGIALATGAPPLLAAHVLIWMVSIQATLTYYAGGSGPVFMALGYIESGDWIKLGFLTSVLEIITWLAVGAVWWKIIGYY